MKKPGKGLFKGTDSIAFASVRASLVDDDIRRYNSIAVCVFCSYIFRTIITWDERKRLANLFKHGLDFADLTMDFFEGAMVFEAKKDRFLALGRLGDELVAAVIFVGLGTEALSVISMRPASKTERAHVR